MNFDPALCAYVVAGQTVRLGTPGATGGTSTAGPAPTLTVASSTDGAVTAATVTASGPGAATADLANARWRITPAAATYSSAQLFGAAATWKHTKTSTGSSAVTVYVPRLDGGADIQLDTTITYATAGVSGLFPKTTVNGGDTINVEAGFGFVIPATRTARLLQTAGPEVTSDPVIVDTRTVQFAANTGVALSKAITFPAAAGKGVGREYRWVIDMGSGHTVQSGPLPVWTLGDSASCKPQDLSTAPTSIAYPDVYTRPAAQTPQVTPAPGKTYADHVNAFVADWKALNLSAPVGGAWISFNDYFSNIYWVDLDDPAVPRYRFRQWDVWQWGYVQGGWYGTDSNASPFPRSKVAVDVPVPDNAAPSVGTDRSLCIVGLRNGAVERIWEMWLAQKMADSGWRAASIGVTTAADEWRHSRSYTVAAAGISALAYALRVTEAKAAVDYVRAERAAGRTPQDAEIVKRVPHALSINQPNPRSGQFSYPATYSDGGSGNPAVAWEGQLVYLRADAPIDAQKYPPLHHVIAVVGKHRGFRVTDRTSWNTSLIVEGDQSYGGGIWSTIRDPNESWKVTYPDDWFVIGRQYASKAAFDADTTT